MIQLIEGYQQKDPPSTPQLTLPTIAVPKKFQQAGDQSNNNVIKVIIAFYYLLRLGEYVKPKKSGLYKENQRG